MEFIANRNKRVEIEVEGEVYLRHAIHTHFVNIGEDFIALIERYVLPVYEPGDILSVSEKVVALCQRRVVYRSEMHISLLARLLSRFATRKSSAGIGVGEVCKMQFAIDRCGAGKVLLAAVCAGAGKMVGRRGIFYEMVGQEVTGLDGFYPDVFPAYGEFGICLPENSSAVCEEVYAKTGVRAMIVDANDFTRDVLGKTAQIEEGEDKLCGMIADNPAGQSDDLTPFILIRKKAG